MRGAVYHPHLPATGFECGTPARVLIETCAPGGGYILAASAAMDEGNPDNLRAMMEAAAEYGVYA